VARRPSTAPRAVARRVAKLTALQYQLRIELKHIKPPIWRRVLVPENVTLAKLHGILQWTMGWQGGHLHEYVIGPCRYGTPDEDWPSAEPMIDERRVRLNALVEHGNRRLTYIYDMGDYWEHIIKVEDIVVPKGAWIQCLAGENACPPEDVGGSPGYEEFLEAVNDPAHEDHLSMLKWAGGAFDPSEFDLASTNALLATIKI
jgi:Plasmid pRiA4b ORF-3-like protein